MHLLVLVEARSPVPPEVFPSLLGEFAAWREQYGNSMESFDFFVGGGGGFGVINIPDKVSRNRMMVEYPFTPFSETTVRPRLDRGMALGHWWEIMGQMMGGVPKSGVEPSH